MTLQYENLYETALNDLNNLYAQFSKVPGYIREKSGLELSLQQAKKVFGRFTPQNKEFMKNNDNGGVGVDILLEDGNTINIPNQLDLYNRVVSFNKEKGGFCDEELIRNTSPTDYEKLRILKENVKKTKKDLLDSYPLSEQSNAFAKAREIETRVKENAPSLQSQTGNKTNPTPNTNSIVQQSTGPNFLSSLLNSLATLKNDTETSFTDFLSIKANNEKKQLLSIAKTNTKLFKDLNKELNTATEDIEISKTCSALNKGLNDFEKHFKEYGVSKYDSEIQKELNEQNELMHKNSALAEGNQSESVKEVIAALKSIFEKVFKKVCDRCTEKKDMFN